MTIAKFLCSLGLHKWGAYYLRRVPSLYKRECLRCGKSQLKIEGV